ncbi:MAG: selenite/tellurite reduction operon protein ExtJ [Trichloromonadaceae bacterium]
MKRMIAVVAAALMIAAFAGGALAMDALKGKVTAVAGDVVTIEVEKGKGAEVTVGAEVEIEVKEEKKAPKKGNDMLQGC